jgi:hypothetical protein
MVEPPNLPELVGRAPDERLLSTDLPNLPEVVGQPEIVPESHARRRIVGTGATLTAVSLVLGTLLAVFGLIEVVANGIEAASVLPLVLGLLLVGTHWGWVHVAEITANSVEGRSHAEVLDRRRQWLSTIEPYTHYEVTTSVEDDGSITIYSVRHRPVVSGSDHFTFVREVEHQEVHSPDEPAAAITDRAEQLRREAALETEREHERYRIAADAYEAALMDREDEQQRRLAERAAAEALSRQINSNLRDPPLVE